MNQMFEYVVLIRWQNC